MSEKVLLDIKDLDVKLFTEQGVLPVLDHISLSVEKGEILGIVGESGCGKSMLASAIIGLIADPGKVTNGQILYDGKDLNSLSVKEKQKLRGKEISMIFQEPMTSLNPLMKCVKQIEEAIAAHEKISAKEKYERTIEALKQVGIPMPEQVYNEVPSRLSGGMRQRVMIAMALVCHPKLLLCDEPTTALDVTIQAQILRLIRKLRKETGTSVIFISHDMGVISEMADYVVVMYAGEIVEQAKAADIFNSPWHPYTIGLQQAIPRLNDQVDRLHDIPGSVPMLNALPKGCLFCPRCPFAKEKCRQERPEIVWDGDRAIRCFYPRKEVSE